MMGLIGCLTQHLELHAQINQDHIAQNIIIIIIQEITPDS